LGVGLQVTKKKSGKENIEEKKGVVERWDLMVVKKRLSTSKGRKILMNTASDRPSKTFQVATRDLVTS